MKNQKSTFQKWLVLMLSLLIAFSLSMTVMAAAKPSINKKSVTLTVGKTVQLKINNNTKTVTWSTSKKSVATVSSSGKVKAVKAGTATITAKTGGKKYTCKVTVKNADSEAYNVSFKVEDGGDFVKSASKATVSFKLKYTSTDVKVSVTSLSGSVLYTKTFSKCKANKKYSFQWDGAKKSGGYAGTGTYLVRITAGSTKTYSSELKFYAKNDFAGGDGSKKNPYKVKTLAQLKKVNKHNGCYFKQTANINGDSANFSPMFTADNPFTGVYNGGGFTISNLYFRKTGNSGLFTSIGTDGMVTNVKISAFTFPGDSGADNYNGTIAGINNGTILNCQVSNCKLNGGSNRIGGIVGTNYGLIEQCTVSDTELNSSKTVGGITSFNEETGQIVDCVVRDISITESAYSGGIAGYCTGGTISGCSTEGTLTLNASWGRCGAIIGRCPRSLTLSECYTESDYELIGSTY